MRNVTITLDDDTARWARVEAAKRDTSVSRLVGQMLRSHMDAQAGYRRAQRAYTSRAVVPLKAHDARYPRRPELHER